MTTKSQFDELIKNLDTDPILIKLVYLLGMYRVNQLKKIMKTVNL